MSACLWDPAPNCPSLSKAQVHVWAASLGRSASSLALMYDVLSLDERVRAERFHFVQDREKYIMARGSLRNILGRYLDVKPGEIRFTYNSHGKPALDLEFAANQLKFNVSHSTELALYAVTADREIGVDIEHFRSSVVEEDIAERFFSPGEVAVLRALPQQVQVQAFFACWTRKEAYIKARGQGLSIPLDQFEVSLVPGQPASLERVFTDPDEVHRWTVQDLAPAPEYAGAVCVGGRGWELNCWRLPDGEQV